MKKILLLLLVLFIHFPLYGCSNDETNKEIENTEIIVENLNSIDIEVDETYNMKFTLSKYEGLKVSVLDSNIVNIDSNVLIGVSIGETGLLLKLGDKEQKVKVSVHEKGGLSSTFSFDKERLAGKRIIAFGDSVTANATIEFKKTYFDYFASKFKMVNVKNYAIGGTTATYMYKGSNIYKEYFNNTTAIDGVRVVKSAYDAGELSNIDYAFIAYGHNDQYFQPPISVEGDDIYDLNSFDSCHSFKGSYRYMINTLKLANPDIRIIILGCTYSEYDLTNPSKYGKKYSYIDYRNAMKEIALEYNLTYIDSWDYLKTYFDAYNKKYYYKDSVHLSAEGHILLADYIIKLR